jgi:predicted RNA-binding Zn ribbon-like protein
VLNKRKPESVCMAYKDIGYLCVEASQFSTATKQVYAVPKDICVSAELVRETTNPFYAARPDVAGKRRPFDLAEFIETAVPLTAVCEAALAEPRRERRIVIMKKRG